MQPPDLGIVDPLYALRRAPGASIQHALRATLAELDRFGVARAGVSLDGDPALARAALAAHPDRFFARTEVDPRRGGDELRRLARLARELPLRLVTAAPARVFLPIDDKLFYPLFAKCVELDLAICPSLGVPLEPVPFAPQKLERIDPIACFFPELRIVMRGDLAPWQELARLLMRRHPNLSFATAGQLPSEIPSELLDFANGDGAHQVLFASDPALEASPEPFYKALPELGLARACWPLFVHSNSAQILKLL